MKPSTGFMTTSELVEAVKRRAYIPSAQNTITEDDIIKFLNEEMKDNIVPLLKASKENYLVYPGYLPLVSNTDKYSIPSRAVGGVLRDIKYKDTQGNLYGMTEIQPEDRHYFQGTERNRFMTFYIEGDSIVLFPGVGVDPLGGLQVLYYIRPNDLVMEDEVGQITAIDRTTGVITLSSFPVNFEAFGLVDLLQWKPGHRIIEFDVPLLAVNSVSKQITLDPLLIPADLIVNDIIASAGECIMPQLPSELQTLLIEKVVAQCMKAQGDMEGYTLSQADLAKKEAKATTLIKNRSEGTPEKVNNLGGTLRYAKIGRRF